MPCPIKKAGTIRAYVVQKKIKHIDTLENKGSQIEKNYVPYCAYVVQKKRINT